MTKAQITQEELYAKVRTESINLKNLMARNLFEAACKADGVISMDNPAFAEALERYVSNTGEMSLRSIEERTDKKIAEIKNADPKAAKDFNKNAKKFRVDIEDKLKNKSGIEALIGEFIKKLALEQVPFLVKCDKDQGMFKAGDIITMFPDEKAKFVDSISDHVEFPIVNLQNFLKIHKTTIEIVNALTPIVQKRMIEFFGEPLEGGVYGINAAKLQKNKEAFAEALDKDIRGYNILLSAMAEVGGNREYPEREKLIAALLLQLAEIDPKTLETNRKAITKLCTKAIGKYSSKSFPFLGDNTVTVKPEELDQMGAMLKSSLARFQQAPQQAVVEQPNSLPADMPAPSSPPIVDRSKLSEKAPALRKPRPSTTPFPSDAAARPASRKGKKEQPKVVTAVDVEKWEQAELMPHGMPAPEWQKANPTKPIPPVPLAVSINRPRSDAIDVGSVQQEDRPSSAPPSIVTPPIPPAPPMSPKSEVSHTSPSAPSESLKKNPVLEAEERSRREIEGWRSGYESLGFVGRLGVSKRPESHKNLGQSVKAWREWHEDNKEYLAKKKFALPAEYKDVMSKLQVAEDVGRVVGSVYSEESRGVLRELKHLDDDAARLSILRKEAENKRASREEHLRSAPANIISAGDVQEHDTPYPPPKVSKVDALNKEREEEKKKGSNMR